MYTFKNLILVAVVFIVLLFACGLAESQEVPETPAIHSADTNGDYIFQLPELLRVVQMFNIGVYYYCGAGYSFNTVDGFCLQSEAEGEYEPIYHSADINHDNRINIAELLRVIQLFNTRGYHVCPDYSGDGFCPGLEMEDSFDISVDSLGFGHEYMGHIETDYLVAEISATELPLSWQWFTVEFYIDGQWAGGDIVLPDSIFWIVEMPIEALLSPGQHQATVVIDYQNQLMEIDGANNYLSVDFFMP